MGQLCRDSVAYPFVLIRKSVLNYPVKSFICGVLFCFFVVVCRCTIRIDRFEADLFGDGFLHHQKYSDYDFPVDVLYTWTGVMNADQIGDAMDDCPSEPGGVQRFRDLGLFRISLELTLRNLPWVRVIHVVVKRKFVPCWLVHPKINVVYEEDIFNPEDQHVLPVHTSLSIEANIGHIEGLAEHFVYIQDDMIFLNPVAKASLFSADGIPRVLAYQSAADAPPWEYYQTIDQLSQCADHLFLGRFDFLGTSFFLQRPFAEQPVIGNFLHCGLPTMFTFSHAPTNWRKSWFIGLERLWPARMRTLRQNKCRHSHQRWGVFQMMFIFGAYQGAIESAFNDISYKMGTDLTYKSIHSVKDLAMFQVLGFRVPDAQYKWQKFFDDLRISQPDIITLNDNFASDGFGKLKIKIAGM